MSLQPNTSIRELTHAPRTIIPASLDDERPSCSWSHLDSVGRPWAFRGQRGRGDAVPIEQIE
jgi:hypothetical protein